MMERSRVRDRGRGWHDDIQRGNKRSEMMGKKNQQLQIKNNDNKKMTPAKICSVKYELKLHAIKVTF